MSLFRKAIVVVCALLWVSMLCAEIPAGYYTSVDGKKGSAITSTLHGIIDDHTVVDYSDLEPYYAQTDLDSSGNILDMYSLCQFTMDDANCQQKKVCDCWNKEHAVPQSWFGYATPMKSDLFHVIPTDARVNNFRSNSPYGETSSTAYIDKDSHALGHIGASNFSGYTGTVYEPDSQYKGDFARIYFYMVTRYLDKNLAQSNGSAMFSYSGGQLSLTTYSVNLLLKWHRQDPVSQKEIDRNNAVYGIQKNRNPFVDYPYLAEYIWGKESANKLDMTKLISSEDPAFIPGVSDGRLESTDPALKASVTGLTFPTMKEGESKDTTFVLQGLRLTAGIQLAISGTDAGQFGVYPTSITAAASAKNTIRVTYSPTAKGVHSAVLTISSEGAKSIQIALAGACAAECKVEWKVDGEAYTAGDPTTSVVMGGTITQLPSVPTSCSDVSEQFMGWTQQTISGTTDEAPDDLFLELKNAPQVTGDVVFQACFARLTITGGETPEVLEWTGTTAGWTNSKMAAKSGYYVLISGASLTSPSVQLQAVDSIKINMRTYGGTSYNTVLVQCGTDTIATLVATSNSLKDYIWTSDSTLRGSGPLVFTSPTTTKTYGPGIAQVTITSEGKKYEYDRYLTSCQPSTADPMVEEDKNNVCYKFIYNGQLYLEYNGLLYNAQGQPISILKK